MALRKIKKRYNNFKTILTKLVEYDSKIVLISRKDVKEHWNNRCLYLDDNYNEEEHYNHRTILKNEVVIEYDFDEPELNNELANRVITRLRNFKIPFGKYKSGNKSSHIHIFLKIPDSITDISLLKRTFMKFFGTMYRNRVTGTFYYDKYTINESLWKTFVTGDGTEFTVEDVKTVNKRECNCVIEKILPDMQLASSRHPIRAEFGLHEKTGKHKTPMILDEDYLEESEIPLYVLEKYGKEKMRQVKYSMTKEINKLDEHPLVKELLNAIKFRTMIKDGRERIMFALIHILKHNHTKEDLIKLLQDWYKYSSGIKLSPVDIRNKVIYHYNKDYKVGINYIKNICEDIGYDIS